MMMKIFVKLVCLCILFFSSCVNSNKREKDIEDSIKSAFIEKNRGLTIPDSLSNLVGEVAFDNDFSNSKFVLIHTLDLTCNACVRELNMLSSYFDVLKKNYGVKIIIIASGSYLTNEINETLIDYPHPILLDEDEIFKSQNRIIRDDVLCSFLIRKNMLLQVGDLKKKDFQKEVELLLKQES